MLISGTGTFIMPYTLTYYGVLKLWRVLVKTMPKFKTPDFCDNIMTPLFDVK